MWILKRLSRRLNIRRHNAIFRWRELRPWYAVMCQVRFLIQTVFGLTHIVFDVKCMRFCPVLLLQSLLASIGYLRQTSKKFVASPREPLQSFLCGNGYESRFVTALSLQ